MISLLIKSVIVVSFLVQGGGNQLRKLQRNHRSLQTSNLPYIANLSNFIYTNEILDNILIPRVVGTPNHQKVFNYIKSELLKLDWNVEVDAFEQKTPIFGKLMFKNIIATLNPNAERYLVLACHYDSKYFEDIVFVGAVDAAVPCAMLLNLVKVMKNDLSSLKDNINLNLKLIFFDGEEAFLNWGPHDSIYGANHLAKIYDNNRHQLRNGDVVSGLDKIDILVLLDLIGHKGTRFYNYFENTKHWYLKLAEIEDQLNNLHLLKKPKNKRYFVRRQYFGVIEDDHVPFLRRDVPVLHLIASPFPEEWHTEKDNRAILDMTTIEDINMILRVFVVEYLNIYLQENKEAQILHKEL